MFIKQICQTLRLRLEQRVRQQRQRLQSSSTGTNIVNGTVESQALIWDRQRSSVLRRNDARRERNIIRLINISFYNNQMHLLSNAVNTKSYLFHTPIKITLLFYKIRLKRTIKLLCWIGAIFCICWLPLNLWNAILDSTKIGVSDTVNNPIKFSAIAIKIVNIVQCRCVFSWNS